MIEHHPMPTPPQFTLTDNQPPLEAISDISDKFAQMLQSQGHCEVNAVLIGNEIHLKSLANKHISKKEPLIVLLGEKSIAIIYPYGAIVFFNADTPTTVELITRCQQYTTQLFSTPETEEFSVIIQPDQPEGIVQNKVSIKKVSKERLEIMGDALAKSLILEYHENRIGMLFDKIEPIAKSLKEHGKLGLRANVLLKHIGSSLLMAQDMVGKIQIGEKPLLLWEHSELEPLHAQLVEDLEIFERQQSLERKIDLISRTAETSLEVLQHRHGHRLEWYIIILISIEIFLQLYELFVKQTL